MSLVNRKFRRLRQKVSGFLVAKGLRIESYSRVNINRLRKMNFDQEFVELVTSTRALSSFSAKLYTTYTAVDYILQNSIQGDLVECGVYKGRHAVVIALTLGQKNVADRDIYLYDTFSGMTDPGPGDVRTKRAGREPDLEHGWNEDAGGYHDRKKVGPLEEVKRNVDSTGYTQDRFHYMRGDIRETLPNSSHESIALLRLDIDWYELTKHAITHLYDLVSPGGLVIIDDYGSHIGARKAVDEFFESRGFSPFLARTEKGERVLVKLS